jgi:hypothetical protein
VNLDRTGFTTEQNKQHSLNVEAKTHLRDDEQADFFLIDFYLCQKTDIAGLDKVPLNGEPRGIIKRSGLQSTWAEWDATVLQAGTKIYRHPDRINIFIAVENGKRTAYMDILEREPAIKNADEQRG